MPWGSPAPIWDRNECSPPRSGRRSFATTSGPIIGRFHLSRRSRRSCPRRGDHRRASARVSDADILESVWRALVAAIDGRRVRVAGVLGHRFEPAASGENRRAALPVVLGADRSGDATPFDLAARGEGRVSQDCLLAVRAYERESRRVTATTAASRGSSIPNELRWGGRRSNTRVAAPDVHLAETRDIGSSGTTSVSSASCSCSDSASCTRSIRRG